MGNLHNTRILRFLIVLATVILTIFIYASYSSNASLAPPHAHNADAALAMPAALHNYQSHTLVPENKNATSTGDGIDSKVNIFSSNGILSGVNNNNNNNNNNKFVTAGGSSNKIINTHAQKSLSEHSSNTARKSHHREPTIDVDAGGGSGIGANVGSGSGGSNNDEPNEAALINPDVLEEQYAQNVDNTQGNVNNTYGSGAVKGQQQQQQQQSPMREEQQLNNQLLIDNNANKILDSDVLIPTSNLQKFIENADKILKNFTAVPSEAGKSLEKSQNVAQPLAPAELPSADAIGDNNDDDALPPSVIMTIKRQNAAEPAIVTTKVHAVSSSSSSSGINNSSSKKPVPKTITTIPVDPSSGIQTKQLYEYGHLINEINVEKLCPNAGKDLKLLILITSAQSHIDARLAIRQTWGHYGIRRDVSTAFILGRSTNETLNLALSQENFVYGDLIRGNFIDSYNNLTLKTVSALEWVDAHCLEAKYVLKTDDDMFINVPKLLAFLDNHAKEKRVIYGRLAKKWKPIRNKKSKYYVSTGQFVANVFPPFTTGPAYVMSNDIIHDLYKRSLEQVYLKLEDVFTTGIVAQKLGIKRVHVNEFLNRRIAFNACNIRKTISVHMVKPNEQFDLWKKLLDQSTKCK